MRNRNPSAKLLAAFILLIAAFATGDPLTPALLLVVELAVAPFFVPVPVFLRRSWPLLVGVAGVLVAQLFAADGLDIGIGLRLLAAAVPGVLVMSSTDPTDMADSLVQNAKAPARFAYGTLAAWRLLPLLSIDWEMLRLARRARGITPGRNPVRLFASTLFGLLVGAIRRGTRLATAMDARGFDATVPRTFARRQRFGGADVALVAAAMLISAVVITISVRTGRFAPLLAWELIAR